ncbi:MAG: ABC transporter permease [Oscillospiraceae bacterium]|nr:ABC transporter permease [Oscillospiraceae bacterium]
MKANKFGETLRDVGIILLNIGIAMLIGSLFILLQGENPLKVYYYLLIDPLTSVRGIVKVLGKATPLIFTGLAAVVCFRCNIFNVGVEGQIYMGALAGAFVLLFAPIKNNVLMIAAAACASMLAAGAWAALAAWLKIRFNVHEVISTIMLNYVASSVVSYVIINQIKKTGSNPRTESFANGFTKFMPPEHLNTGILVALAAVALLTIFLYYTPTGWRIDASGKNLEAARFSGISSKRLILVAMLISGALAGLCGLERTAGAYGYMEVGFSPGYGYDGMIVAIIGRNNPVGALITALFFGLLHYGGVNINMYTDVATEWVYVLISIMFILVAARDGILKNILNALRGRKGGREK